MSKFLKLSEARELTEMNINEVSLVDRPANQKKFMFVKNLTNEKEDSMKILKDLFKNLSGNDLTEKEVEVIKAMPEELQKTMEDCLKVIETYKQDLPSDLLNSINKLASLVTSQKADPTGKEPSDSPYPEKDGENKKMPDEMDELKKLIAEAKQLLASGGTVQKAEEKPVEKKESKKDEENITEIISKQLQEISKRLEVLESVKNPKTSLDQTQINKNTGLKWGSVVEGLTGGV